MARHEASSASQAIVHPSISASRFVESLPDEPRHCVRALPQLSTHLSGAEPERTLSARVMGMQSGPAMPILAYFAFVVPALVGLLFFAEAMMGPAGPMPLTTASTGIPAAFVAPKTAPVLTVREGLVAEIPKAPDSYALASTGSVPGAAPAQADIKPVKAKVAKVSKKKAAQNQLADSGSQQNQPWVWDKQPKRSSGKAAGNMTANRDGSGRFAMSGQQPFFSPFGMIR